MESIIDRLKQSILYHNVKHTLFYRFFRKDFKRNNETLNLLFLVTRPNTWSSVQSVYDAAKQHPNVHPYIIALPPRKNGRIACEDNSVYEFCKSIDKNAVNAYDAQTKQYLDLEKLKPDYILVSIPYKSEYPAVYNFKTLAGLARLCYIPYGYTLVCSKIQDISVTADIQNYVSYIFAESKITYDYCRKRLWLSQLISGKRLYDIGFPRFDLYDKKIKDAALKVRNVLWLPRWTTKAEVADGRNEPSSFFKFKDAILDYFERNNQISLMIRPHPKAFETYLRHGIMTEAEIQEYKNRIAAMSNAALDSSPSYYERLLSADVLISDFSSIVAEYFITCKPVIYFGSGKNYPPEHMEMYHSFYHAKDWMDAERILEKLRQGIDPKKELRKKAVKNFTSKIPENTGKRIMDILIEDYR